MKRTLPGYLMGMILFGIVYALPAAEPPPRADDKKSALPDLSEFRTVEKAITTQVSNAAPSGVSQTSYLGVHLKPDAKGKLVVADLEDESPAAKAGLQRGDLMVKVADKSVDGLDGFRELVQTKAPGEQLKLAVLRQDKPMELTATLAATSRPMIDNVKRAALGLRLGQPDKGEGLEVRDVTPGSPADKAKLKVGEIVRKIDGVAVRDTTQFGEVLSAKKPNDTITLTLFLAEKELDLKVTLAEEDPAFAGRNRGWDNRIGGMWKKDVYHLGVICVEYPDVKHNDKITAKDWQESLFSRGQYKDRKSATGQSVYGSLNDYYWEQSYNNLTVEGKVFDWIEVGKKRAEYESGAGGNKTVLLNEAIDKLVARDKDALKDVDGVFFIYAGQRPANTNRGSLYWPHRANVRNNGKNWPYFICPEGGDRMENISVFCHEFGHMLGLPDLYARPENPGSEGLGVWCAMSNQLGGGKPQHFCAWSKEQLGWVKPAVIDPTKPQKLILSPVEDSPKECVKVLVKPDGSEYLLLENRRKKGFDGDLPAEGLLIWRVVNNHPILEESHGVEGPTGPRVFLNAVPFPSKANNAFTPYTTPSSRSQLGGGYPVHITNIRRLEDGRITFYVGYEFE
jgi:M6 family metalloprotease-like protein